MKTRPPARVGCAVMVRSPAKPKAHFTFRRGTSVAVNPAVGWKRVFDVVTPQPFHCGPFREKLAEVVAEDRHIADAGGLVSSVCESVLPETNCAMARRSSAVRRLVTEIIAPVSSAASTRSADSVGEGSGGRGRGLPRPLMASGAHLFVEGGSVLGGETRGGEQRKNYFFHPARKYSRILLMSRILMVLVLTAVACLAQNAPAGAVYVVARISTGRRTTRRRRPHS